MATIDFRAGSTAIGGMGKGGGSGGGKKPLQSRPGRAQEESEDDYDSDELEREFQGFSTDDEPPTKGARFRSRSRAPEIELVEDSDEEEVTEWLHAYRPVEIKPAYHWLISRSGMSVQRPLKLRSGIDLRVSDIRKDVRNWEAAIVQSYGQENAQPCKSCAGYKHPDTHKASPKSIKRGVPGMKIRPRSTPAGKFSSCVSMPTDAATRSGVSRPPWQNRECANCLWGGQGNRCSLRPDRGEGSARSRSMNSRKVYQENPSLVRSKSLIRAGLDLDTSHGLQLALKESRTQVRALKRRLTRLQRGQPLSPVRIPGEEQGDDESENEEQQDDEDSGEESSSEEDNSLDDDEPIIPHLRGRSTTRK